MSNIMLPSVEITEDQNAVTLQGAGKDGKDVTLSAWELTLGRGFIDSSLTDMDLISPAKLATAVEDNMDKVAQVAPEHQLNYVEDCLHKVGGLCEKLMTIPEDERISPADEKVMYELALSIIESGDNFRTLLQNLDRQYQILVNSCPGEISEQHEEVRREAEDWFRFGSQIISHLAFSVRSQYLSIHSQALAPADSQKGSPDHVAWADLAEIIDEVSPSFLEIPAKGFPESEKTHMQMLFNALVPSSSVIYVKDTLFYIQVVGKLEQTFGALDLLALFMRGEESMVSDFLSSSGLVPEEYALFPDYPEGQCEEYNNLVRLVFVPRDEQSTRNANQLRVFNRIREFIDGRSRSWLGGSA